MQKLRILPSQLDEMSVEERAFVYGSIMLRVENDRKEAARVKNKTSGTGRRRRRRK